MMILLGLFATAFQAVYSGWVLSVMWRWFFCHMFGLPVIGIAQAIGITLAVKFLTFQYSAVNVDREKSGAEKIAEAIAIGFVYPTISLFVGWIVKMFL